MRRYRGADKPPSPTLSPPPYSKNSGKSGSRSQAVSSRNSTRGSVTRQAFSGLTALGSDNEVFNMRGLTTASAPFLDPMVKRPTLPAPGRTIPKLKMADLTSSLAPLVESRVTQSKSSRPTPTDKRVAEALKEVTTDKDMLESFDDALKSPDMRAINSRVAQLRKGIGPRSQSPKASSTRVGINASLLKTKAVSSDSRKIGVSKVTSKSEEQNIRKLMGQLKEKYLDDMESQLGLAIERKPKRYQQSESMIGGKGQDQIGDGPVMGIPRPSTDATEITSRIDKVVREWATESQKFSTAMKSPSTSAKQRLSLGGMPKINNSTVALAANLGRGDTIQKDGQNIIAQSSPVGSEKNRHFAKIPNAFRKSLDPISKRDVRELISIPDDGHMEQLEQEHEERVKAHESMFKNAVVSKEPSSDQKKITDKSLDERKQKKKHERNQIQKQSTTDESASESASVEYRRTKSSLVSANQSPFGKSLEKSNENEVYNIIKQHMEIENSSGAPKLTSTQRNRTTKRGPPNASLLRSDVAGKALLKYSDSHKKLQTLVDSFTEKIDSSGKKILGPAEKSEQVEHSDEEKIVEKVPVRMSVSSVVSASAVNTRRRNSSEANSTLRGSMKTIDRASSVAQRLGTLMSRVALRNEAYDYEKQQEAKEAQQKALSLSVDNQDLPVNQARTTQSMTIQLQGSSQNYRSNPYELTQPSTSDLENHGGVPPGVSKLDSTQFSKYVDEMKKVAEKAAASFEKFKERQIRNDVKLGSYSEDEEEVSEPEYNYQGGGEAAAVAAAAAEIVAIQEQEKKRKAVLERVGKRVQQQQRNSYQQSSPRMQTNVADAGTSPRESETTEIMSQINQKFTSDVGSSNGEQVPFKFVPDMSYTDQLMLQKLRKLKEKEGWDSALKFGAENENMAGDVPNQADIESMIKRSTNMNLPRETERPSMGPISLNAILRSRLNSKNK